MAGRLILLAVAAVLAVAPAARASTVPASDEPLTGSTFQGGDGNQVDEGGFVDWESVPAGHNPDPNAVDDVFADGKDEHPGGWRFTTQSDGASPPKSNIYDAWSAVEQRGGNTFLYLGFTREFGNGDSYLAFDLNRDGRLWDNGHAMVPCRRTGDLIVAVIAHGTGHGVEVALERWRTTDFDPGSGCATDGVITRVADIAAGDAQGAVNDGPIVSRLPGHYPPGTTISGIRLFGEVALNLSALVDAAFDDTCLAFGSIWMHSRASDEVNSEFKDYVAPRPLIVRSCAAAGQKFFDLDADGTKDPGEPGIPGFVIWADYDNDGVHDPGEPATVTDARGRYILDDIRPGAGRDYRLRETTLPQFRHRAAATAWLCSFPNAGTIPDGGFPDGPGGLFGCGWGPIDPAATPFPQGKDFGDWLPARLTLTKALFPSDDPGRFNLIVNGEVELPGAGDGATTTLAVLPGGYTVSEAAVPPADPADYHSIVTCRTTPAQRGRASASVQLDFGDQASCKFINVRDGAAAIAIEKTGPETATAGDTLRYRFYVTNPGALPFPERTIKVTDPNCDRRPRLVSKGGDTSPRTLDPGDTWTYACRHKTAAPTADCTVGRLRNTATASGSVGGVTETDDSTITTALECPDEPPDPPEPGPPPQPVTPAGPTPPAAGSSGVAGISAANRCLTRVSQIRLTGERMHVISVRVNGRLVSRRTLRFLQRRATPLLRVLPAGRHRIAVRVSFDRGSATPPVTLKRTIRVCAASRPRVTG